MDFIRNKEVKRQIVVSSILILFWGGIGIIVDSKAVWIVLSGYHFIKCSFPLFYISEIQENCCFSLHIDRLLHEEKRFLLSSFKKANYLFYMMKYLR